MIVGREEEDAILGRALTSAAAGRTTLVAIEGEAGMGKSSLLRQITTDATAMGFTVLRADADDFQRSRTFGPIVDAVSQLHPGELRDAVLEAVATAPSNVAATVILGGAADQRHQVVDRLCALVEHLAISAPLALVFDDLHWSDESTLLALRTVARRVEGYRLLIAVAGRPEPSTRAWATLLDQAAEVVIPRPLTSAEGQNLLENRLSARIGPNLRNLSEGTGGNPLLLDQLGRGLRIADLHTTDDGTIDVASTFVPATFSAAVLRSLLQLSPVATEIVRAASVLGTACEIDVIAAMIGRSVGRLIPAVDEVVRAGLFSPSGRDVAFRHVMVRNAVASSLPDVVRSSLHRQAAEVLTLRRAPAARIADHLGAAGGDDAPTYRAWLRRAAAEAMGRSPEVANRLLSRARDGLEKGSPGWIDVGLDQLEAATNGGLVQEALLLGAELVSHPLSAQQRVTALHWHGGALFLQQRTHEAAAMFETAVRESTDPLQRALLASYLGLVKLVSFMPDAEEAIERAVSASEVDGDSESRCLALLLRSRVFGSQMRFAESTATARAAKAIGDADAGGAAQKFQPAWFLGLSLADEGYVDDALRVLDEGQRMAEQIGASWADGIYLGMRAVTLYCILRFDEADAEAAAGIAVAEETGAVIAVGWSYAVASLIAIQQERFEDASQAVKAGEALFDAGHSRLGSDLLSLARSRLLDAAGLELQAFEHLYGSWQVFEATPIEISGLSIAVDLADLAARLGRLDALNDVRKATERWVERDTASKRLLGVRVAVEAIATDDTEGLGRAIFLLRESGQSALALRLEERVALVSGRATAAAIAKAGNVDAANSHAGTSHAANPTDHWLNLSPAEQRVALAVGRGMANKAIARELLLSTRTIETHVSRILRKMDVTSRLELAIRITGRTTG